MALGAAGPPASAKQIAYLTSLLAKAGYSSLREARHPYGLTQRQSNGKFTTREASALIDRLLGNPDRDDDAIETSGAVAGIDEPQLTAQATVVRGFHADVLADELRRRGWTVREPPS